MVNRAKAAWLSLVQGLWFVPALIIISAGILAVVLLRIDQGVSFDSSEFVFAGDAPAARTVLSVIAGSLITVAGLTFSLTVVVLQLASSQFSPRVLSTFFADRMTQVTAGAFVGIFVYSLIVLRGVGSIGEEGGFVPRISITVASGLGVITVLLLIAFIHHISQMIQVSELTSSINEKALKRLETLYPEPFGEPAEDEDGTEALESWRRAGRGGLITPKRSGYVQLIGIDELVKDFDDPPERLAILVRPGDFVSIDAPLAEVWPASAAKGCEAAIRNAIAIGGERTIHQDVNFALRQLADIAVKAMSPGINDPTTAATCIGYLRSILVRLADRKLPDQLRRFPEHDVEMVVLRRSVEEHLESLIEVGRYGASDARVAEELLLALQAVAKAARQIGAERRAEAAESIARTVAAQAVEEAKTDRDRESIERLLEKLRATGKPLARDPALR